MSDSRNYGLDVARITAMCGIIILHINGTGGGLQASDAYSINYWILWWVEICAFCSVNLFALLSGWFGTMKKNNSIFRLLQLGATVFFYSVLITIIFAILYPDVYTSWKDVVKSIAPVLVGRYWYITCYIPLALLQPYINKMLSALSKEQHKILCGLCILIFSILPTFLNVDFFAMGKGYSFAWLLVCYIIGAYLGRAESECKHGNIILMVIFLFSSIILLVGNIFIYLLLGVDMHYAIEYTSPVIFVMTVAVLLSMNKMKINYGKKILQNFSAVSFDVYIIHCHALIFDNFIKDNFSWIVNLRIVFIPFAVIGCAISLFVALALIGNVRSFIFEKLLINKGLKRISIWLDSIIYKSMSRLDDYPEIR